MAEAVGESLRIFCFWNKRLYLVSQCTMKTKVIEINNLFPPEPIKHINIAAAALSNELNLVIGYIKKCD